MPQVEFSRLCFASIDVDVTTTDDASKEHLTVSFITHWLTKQVLVNIDRCDKAKGANANTIRDPKCRSLHFTNELPNERNVPALLCLADVLDIRKNYIFLDRRIKFRLHHPRNSILRRRIQ
jgi:hypothetical protein